jgi:hypothetical protein
MSAKDTEEKEAGRALLLTHAVALPQPVIGTLLNGVEWGTLYVASIMLITLTVDGWCVLPVLLFLRVTGTQQTKFTEQQPAASIWKIILGRALHRDCFTTR